MRKKIFKRFGQWVVIWSKKCRIPLVTLIILLAIIFSFFRALTPWVKQYKGNVEKHLSTLLGQPVTIQDLETSWYWFEPVLRMDHVTLSSNDQTLKLNKLLVGIDLFSSLWHWQVQPGILYVDDVHLNIRQTDKHWEVDGLSQDHHVVNVDSSSYLPVLAWLLAQKKIIVNHFSAQIHFQNGLIVPIDHLKFSAVQRFGRYQLSGHARLRGPTLFKQAAELGKKSHKKVANVPTDLKIVANFKVDPNAIDKITGQVYLAAQDFSLMPWREVLSLQKNMPTLPLSVESAQGNMELWADLQQSQVTHAQSKIDLHELTWLNEQSKQRRVDLLQANLAWLKKSDGWSLKADQIQLRAGHIVWPNNALALDYVQSQDAYRAFIRSLELDPLLISDFDWPEIIRPLLQMSPRGELRHLQIGIQEKHLNYLLTQFSQLSWKGRDHIPGMRHVSGVLYWQPDEGRLELDSQNTVVEPSKLPPVTFNLLNAAIEWKELSDGLRVSLERFVLSHPNLLLSAHGALDRYSTKTPTSQLRLIAEFAAKDAQVWLPYLPSQYLKPKLNDWLKHDIKRIGAASGRCVVHGSLNDFPFDQNKGEFSIVSHLNGVDLLINEHWPLNQNIEADLTVTKRNLEADIVHAELQGALLDKVHLAIPDIGLGREALLIRGEIEAPAAAMKAYVTASPLRERFDVLHMFNIDELLGLNLQLDIPLYPERDDVLARGALFFDDNPSKIHDFANHEFSVEHVTGVLQFDEHGLLGGGLHGSFNDEPVELHVSLVSDPKPYTEIKVHGVSRLDYWREKLQLPILALLDGHIQVDGQVMLPRDYPDLPRVHIASSLEGMSVDLPLPLGKTAAASVPFAVDMIFNQDKTLDVQVNYAERLHGRFAVQQTKDQLTLQKGEIRLGDGVATLPKHRGLTVIGSIPHFDFRQWEQSFSKLPTQGTWTPMIEHVDLEIDESILWNHIYQNITLKAQRNTKDWEIQLKQRNLDALLRYQPKLNLLSGHVKHLIIDQHAVMMKHPINQSKITLNPQDFPNLDIMIDQFKWNNIEVGQGALKTTSEPSRVLINDAWIKTPEYHLQIQGQWQKNDRHDQTIFQANLNINNLSKSLERWHITPAVQAARGQVHLEGEWPGGPLQFALEKVDGDMQMVLKDGRISHFDRETEEKLGLGKLLSILSLQTIPRRLKLDFSDLSEQGYSFDVFKGNFKLQHGILSTQNSYIDGPVAYASMKGDLNLSRHLYDLDLRVSPYIGASLPVVATIAGGPVAGPIAGLATWVAMNIINKGMQKISGYTYKISGPWLNPVVQQVSIERKKNQGNKEDVIPNGVRELQTQH